MGNTGSFGVRHTIEDLVAVAEAYRDQQAMPDDANYERDAVISDAKAWLERDKLSDRTWTAGALAEELGVTAEAVERAARQREIPATETLFGHYFFDLDEVLEWIGDKEVKPIVYDHNDTVAFLRRVEDGDDLTRDEVKAAIRHAEIMHDSGQKLLHQLDRFRSQGNSLISDLERELDDLERGLRNILVDLDESTSTAEVWRRLRVLLREEDGGHDGCRTCRCWERERGESE